MTDDSPPAEMTDISGAGDEPYLTPVQGNKMVATILNQQKRFPYGTDVAKFAIRTTIRNMKDDDARVRNGAVRNLMAMARINQIDEHKMLEVALDVVNPKQSGVSVNVGVNVGDLVRQVMESDPDYIKFRNSQLADGRAVPAGMGEVRVIGRIPDAPASGDAG